MKKILFGIFAIILCMPSAYSDGGQKIIDPNGSYQSVLQSEVRVDAIRGAMENLFFITSMEEFGMFSPTKFVTNLKKSAIDGITLKAVLDACNQEIGSEIFCSEFVDYIVQEHNRLVLEGDTGVLSQESFTKLINSALECPDSVLFRPVYTEDKCKALCKEYASKHLCKIEYIDFTGTDEHLCTCNPAGKPNSWTIMYRYIPTYEDYKRAKGVR